MATAKLIFSLSAIKDKKRRNSTRKFTFITQKCLRFKSLRRYKVTTLAICWLKVVLIDIPQTLHTETVPKYKRRYFLPDPSN